MKLQFIHVLDDLQIDPRIRVDYGDLETLKQSILLHGPIQSLRVDSSAQPYTLIAGGRRVAAARALLEEGLTGPGWDGSGKWPALLVETPEDWRRVELEMEENLRRKDMTWKEKVLGLYEIHNLKKLAGVQIGESWGFRDTGELLGVSLANVSYSIMIAKALRSGDQEVQAAINFSEALRILLKRREAEVQAEKERRGLLSRKAPEAGEGNFFSPDEIARLAEAAGMKPAGEVGDQPALEKAPLHFHEATPWIPGALYLWDTRGRGVEDLIKGPFHLPSDSAVFLTTNIFHASTIASICEEEKLTLLPRPFIIVDQGLRKPEQIYFQDTILGLFAHGPEFSTEVRGVSSLFICNSLTDQGLYGNTAIDYNVFRNFITPILGGRPVVLCGIRDLCFLDAAVRQRIEAHVTFDTEEVYDAAKEKYPHFR